MREPLAEDGAGPHPKPPARRAAESISRSAERRDAEQQRLLKDEDEGGWHDVAGVAAGRVEQRLRQEINRRAATGHRRVDEASLAARAPLCDLGRGGRGALRDALQGAAVEKKIGRIDIGCDAGLLASQDEPLRVLWDPDN